jgi:nitrile hydratase subunit beta
MNYEVGQRVRIADRTHRGHHRTPSYIKGKTGQVERVHAAFRNPETRAYGGDGLPQLPLYLVGFHRRAVWPEAASGDRDRIYVDVFEHWLEEAP